MLKRMLSDLFIRIIADYLVFVVVAVGAWAVFGLPRSIRTQRIVWGVITGLLAFGLARFASLFYQGQRPFEAMGVDPRAAYLPNPGFPSDHVLFVCTITLVVWACTKNRKIGFGLLVASALIGVGRVVALVHTPIDVIGGAVCALIAALCIYRMNLFTKDPWPLTRPSQDDAKISDRSET